MDGKRGVRASGTDGSDFRYRQVLDSRYETMAKTKSQLTFLSYGNFIAAALLVIAAFVASATKEGDGVSIVSLLWAAVVAALGVWAQTTAANSVSAATTAFVFASAAGGALSLLFAVSSVMAGEGPFPPVTLVTAAIVSFLGAASGNTLRNAADKRRRA